MRAFKQLALTAALTALTVPAWAELVYSGTGSYNLGSSTAAGATAAPSTSCGTTAGQDTLTFTGEGINNVGIHAYSCNDNVSNFGSRSSGENTFYAQGIASVTGTMPTNDLASFSFHINPGEIGAFGSTAFGADEFQKASLAIKLVIDGTVYMDEAWSAEVGVGGAIANSYTSNGLKSVNWTSTTGAGYFSYGIFGGDYDIDLAAGDHDISYVMTSTAFGSISSTTVCTAVLYGGDGVVATRNANVVAEGGLGAGDPFTSYCGAGARSGDPFPADPIARAQDVSTDLPEPMTAGLALTALLAAAGARRRANKR